MEFSFENLLVLVVLAGAVAYLGRSFLRWKRGKGACATCWALKRSQRSSKKARSEHASRLN